MVEAKLWKWFHYYWNLFGCFGRECYRTWRQELFASIVVFLFVALLTGGWKDFQTAIFATGLTLGCFAIWHLLRVPWLLHRSVMDEEKSPGFFASATGVIVLASIFVGGYQLGRTVWRARPATSLQVTFSAPVGPLPVRSAPHPVKPHSPGTPVEVVDFDSGGYASLQNNEGQEIFVMDLGKKRTKVTLIAMFP